MPDRINVLSLVRECAPLNLVRELSPALTRIINTLSFLAKALTISCGQIFSARSKRHGVPYRKGVATALAGSSSCLARCWAYCMANGLSASPTRFPG